MEGSMYVTCCGWFYNMIAIYLFIYLSMYLFCDVSRA